MVTEAGVKVVEGRLDLEKDAIMEGQRITAIRLEDGTSIKGKMFIDASYEGDLLAAAKVSFTVGREANAKYDEKFPTRSPCPCTATTCRMGSIRIGSRAIPTSGLLPGVNPYDEADVGKGDHRLQAFCYRMCLTDAPDNQVPVTKPKGYDEADYEILFRALDAGTGQWGQFYKFSAMPNRKTDSNNNGGISTDFIGMNYSPLPRPSRLLGLDHALAPRARGSCRQAPRLAAGIGMDAPEPPAGAGGCPARICRLGTAQG